MRTALVILLTFIATWILFLSLQKHTVSNDEAIRQALAATTPKPSTIPAATKPLPLPPPEPVKTFFSPRMDWVPQGTQAFGMERGERTQFWMAHEPQWKVQIEATLPVNVETPCGSQPKLLQGEIDCLTDGYLTITDSRDPQMGTIKAAIGVLRKNNELVNNAVAINRVKVTFNDFNCVAHCPNGEWVLTSATPTAASPQQTAQ